MKDTGKFPLDRPYKECHFIKSNELSYYKVNISYPFKWTPLNGNPINNAGGILLKLGERFDNIEVKLTPDETIHLIVLLQEAFKQHHNYQEEINKL